MGKNQTKLDLQTLTEAVFAGARVGPTGIKPDLTKLTVILDWKQPTYLQNLAAFTGLKDYFRLLIKDMQH